MANIGAALKGMDWKELLINHCEKIVLGGVGLFVLSSLGSTTWSSYKTQPEEIDQKVNAGSSAYAASRWPEENKKEFEHRDLGDEVAKVTQGITPSVNDIYTIGTSWVRPIYPPKLKRGEVNWLVLEEPIADAGKVLLAYLPSAPQGAPGTPVVAADRSTGTNDRALDDDSRPRDDGPRNPATGPMPGLTPMLSDGPAPPMPMPTPGRQRPGAGGGGGGHNPEPMMTPGVPGMMQSMSMGRNVEAEGLRFVAVRAAFPLKRQLEEIRKALQLEHPSQAWELLRFADFKIQRQTALAGDKPWSGKWEDVDIEAAITLLSRVDFDVDVVDERYRDPVITMPLPYRETGSWKQSGIASHPQIRKQLSDEEQARQEAANKAAIETAEKLKLKQTGGKGGFQGIQHNTRDIQRQIMTNSSAMSTFNEMYSNLNGEGSMLPPGMAPGGPGASPYQMGNPMPSSGHNAGMTHPGMAPGMAPGMTPGMSGMGAGQMGVLGSALTIPELLLFRYLDFKVVPGNAYRYRVQLVMKNPNFGWDANELKDPSSANGETRDTKFSEPTKPVVIEDDLRFFVTKIVAKPNGVMTTDIDVFQWLTESGSFVMGTFQTLARGDQISALLGGKDSKTGEKTGGLEVDVLRAANYTYKKERINFETPNVLLNLSVNTVVPPEDNPDLELPLKKSTVRLEEVVMVNRFGEIVEVDNVSQKVSQTDATQRIKRQEDNFKQFRAAAATASGPSALEGYLGASGMQPMPGAPGAPGARNTRRQGSSLRRGGAAGANGMMPGMGAPGMMGPTN